MTNSIIINGIVYDLHHTSTGGGYVSRRATEADCIAAAQPYNGRFGSGYLVKLPRFDTTRYCTFCYYIRRRVIR